MRTICRFEAQEVRNPMLQMVHDLELNEGVRAIGSRSYQVEGQFRGLRNLLSACCDRLPTAVTPSFSSESRTV